MGRTAKNSTPENSVRSDTRSSASSKSFSLQPRPSEHVVGGGDNAECGTHRCVTIGRSAACASSACASGCAALGLLR